ncbi:MAG TPA: type II toxin-antitoxin system prevent-host-death family antitoxin [Thermoanaerobaculia bacterium]|nr:type II toxin-antitoxin system prevent-host-death family antitoxin [Thermoanaerobaculia bacterium]
MAKPRNVHQISASEFKARCLGLLDEIAASRVPLVVTKRGRPIAKLVPVDEQTPPSLLNSVSYQTEDDLLAPVGDVWDAES